MKPSILDSRTISPVRRADWTRVLGAPMSSTTSDGLRADPGEPGTPAQIARLAVLLKDQGKLDEAKAMYERALAGRERTLGADHPHTLGTVNNLAGLLNQVGDAAAAAALRERFGCA